MASKHWYYWIFDVYVLKSKTYTSRAIDYKKHMKSTVRVSNNSSNVSNLSDGMLHKKMTWESGKNVYVLKVKTYTQET